MSDFAVDEGICQLQISDGRWLSTGVRGGFCRANGAVNITVSDDFDQTNLESYVADRCRRANLDSECPALLTAVEQTHARGATAGQVLVIATAGLTNPARLPIPGDFDPDLHSETPNSHIGTVNLLVGTDCRLADGTLTSCLATAVEAKAATLQATTGFTGSTTDAIAVGCDPSGEEISFVGSSTHVGISVRACVRDALLASLDSVHEEVPESVDDAAHGTVTDCETTVFKL